MGGKKKKGIGNKLAKMSDEERARYLQHRAAIEEEAKRRKEQLIATYMKNKLRKEEAFTRLNVAKINEHWHQIMRKIKVKELKIEIQDLKIWITKILEIKNSIIERILVEIEEGEELYEINLRSHFEHLNNFIGVHYERKEYWQKNYVLYRNEILNDAHKELKDLIDAAYEQERFLKTALFGLEKDFNDFIKEIKEFRNSKLEDDSNTNRADHEAMVKSYALKMQKIWKEINLLLKDYLIRTTQKRHHCIEMRHIDERNESTRMRNERRIAKLTETFTTLKQEYDTIYETNEEQIRELTDLKENTNIEFQKLKRNLTSEIKQDEKILKTMTIASNNSLKLLERILEKGKSLRNFLTVCQRLETPNHKLNKWAKFQGNLEKLISQFPEKDSSTEIDLTPEKYSTSDRDSTSEKDSTPAKDKSIEKSSSGSVKSIKRTSSTSSKVSELVENRDTIFVELEFLTKMEGVWFNCNSAEIETAELKKEKSILLSENKNMKQIIKGVLRDAALETPPPKEICFPVFSRIQSAPVQSHKIDLKGVDFLVVDL